MYATHRHTPYPTRIQTLTATPSLAATCPAVRKSEPPPRTRTPLRIDKFGANAVEMARITPQRRTWTPPVRDLEPLDACVLRHVDGERDVDDLARLVGVTRAQIMVIVQRLTEKGFLN